MQYYYLYLCAKFEGKDVLPAASTGFARCCRQAPGLGCTETKLLLLMVLESGAGAAVVCGHTHAHATLLWEERYT